MIVVYDFDKTLTKKDSFLIFIKYVLLERREAYKYLFILFLAILHKLRIINKKVFGSVVELVDTLDSKSCAFGRAGSTPATATKTKKP